MSCLSISVILLGNGGRPNKVRPVRGLSIDHRAGRYSSLLMVIIYVPRWVCPFLHLDFCHSASLALSNQPAGFLLHIYGDAGMHVSPCLSVCPSVCFFWPAGKVSNDSPTDLRVRERRWTFPSLASLCIMAPPLGTPGNPSLSAR